MQSPLLFFASSAATRAAFVSEFLLKIVSQIIFLGGAAPLTPPILEKCRLYILCFVLAYQMSYSLLWHCYPRNLHRRMVYFRKKVVAQRRRYAHAPSGIAAASVLFCGKGAMTKRAVGRVVHCDVVTAEIFG